MASLYDFLFSRRLGGDPTISSRDPGGEAATTYNNPHFREDASKNHGNYIDCKLKLYHFMSLSRIHCYVPDSLTFKIFSFSS